MSIEFMRDRKCMRYGKAPWITIKTQISNTELKSYPVGFNVIRCFIMHQLSHPTISFSYARPEHYPLID